MLLSFAFYCKKLLDMDFSELIRIRESIRDYDSSRPVEEDANIR
jgi:hypothetical protein